MVPKIIQHIKVNTLMIPKKDQHIKVNTQVE